MGSDPNRPTDGRIAVQEIASTRNRQGMCCHFISDASGDPIGTAHNAGFQGVASLFVGEKEIELAELEAIVAFLKTGEL